MSATRVWMLLVSLFFAGCSSLGPFSARRIAQNMNIIPEGDTMTLSEQLNQASREITPEDEYNIGREVAAILIQQYGIIQEERVLTYINMIVQSIALVSERPEVYGGYHAIILDTDEINSYATPGGHILVTKGLIRASRDEDMLAAALAHSVSHIVLAHGTASIRRARLLKMSQILVKAQDSGSYSSLGSRVTDDFIDSVYDQMGASVTSGEQKQQYETADKMAIELMRKLSYCEESLIKLLTCLRMRLSGEVAKRRLIDERIMLIWRMMKNSPIRDCKDASYELREGRFLEATKDF